MAVNYKKLTSPDDADPYVAIVTGGGHPVAHFVPKDWADRIIDGLKLLDLLERSQGSYVEKIKKELGIE